MDNWAWRASPRHSGAFADPRFPVPRHSVYESRRHRWLAIETGAEPLRIADAPLDFTLRVGIASDHADLRRGLEAADGDYDPVAETTDDDDGILTDEETS